MRKRESLPAAVAQRGGGAGVGAVVEQRGACGRAEHIVVVPLVAYALVAVNQHIAVVNLI